MNSESFQCPYCGVSVSADKINFKTRRAHCDFCGQDIVFAKRNSTASPSAINALNQAKEFFMNGNYKSAVSCAQTATEMVPNHAAALYIIAYYQAFSADVKSRTSLENLFRNVLPDAEFEQEEEDLFKELLLKTIAHSIDYEEQILTKFMEYDDPGELGAFVEKFSPFAISKRIDIDWFNSHMRTVYEQISASASIPKTWYALYLSLSKNPISPLSDGSFYLKTRATKFYNEYLIPVGVIYDKIRDEALSQKFRGAYRALKAQYEDKMSKA